MITRNHTGKCIMSQKIRTTGLDFTIKYRAFLHIVHTTKYNSTNEKTCAFLWFCTHAPKITAHTHTHLQKSCHTPIIHLYILIQLCIWQYFTIRIYTKASFTPIIHLYILIILYTWKYLCSSLSHTQENIIYTRNYHNLHTCHSYVSTLSENVASETHHGMKKLSMDQTTHTLTEKKSNYCDMKTWCTARTWARTKKGKIIKKTTLLDLLL